MKTIIRSVVVLRAVLLFFLLAPWACSSAMADDKTKDNPALVISPIFSQLVMFSLPKEFKTVFENKSPDGSRYIREAVLEGENVDRWSQMITATGAKGLAANPNLTGRLFVEQIAGGFKRACPLSFFAKELGAMKISGQDAFIMLASCGTVPSKTDQYSETALLVAIKGSADYYTIQWAERGTASDQPIVPDEARWTDRFKKLSPRICALVPGEAAPYPSCIGQNSAH